MLSFLRPSRISSFSPIFVSPRNFIPQEGVPFAQQNDTHYFIKIFLPDVIEDSFSAEISKAEENSDQKLIIKWKDNKKLSHNGRIYQSSEEFIKEIDIPSEITQDDIESKFDDDGFVIISIQKPKKQLAIMKNSEISPEDENLLMKMKIPKDGDSNLEFSIENGNLTVKYCNVLKKYAGDNKTVISSSQTRMQRTVPLREGITADDIDHKLEDGELQVFLKAKPENNLTIAENENEGEGEKALFFPESEPSNDCTKVDE